MSAFCEGSVWIFHRQIDSLADISMREMKRVLVTGGNGFIGHALLERLCVDRSYHVCTTMRRQTKAVPVGVEVFEGCDLAELSQWNPIVDGVDIVIHTAGLAHRVHASVDDIDMFRRVNVAGTMRLARASIQAGVSKFIFLSSIGVNGIESPQPFQEADVPAPTEPYAISKLEAESALQRLREESSMSVVVIRPPLVYGRGAPGNFSSLETLVRKVRCLPFGAMCNNRRSFVALDNLVDFVITCMNHRNAMDDVFFVSDDQDLSTADFIREMARAMAKDLRFVTIPVWCLELVAAVIGKRSEVRRLSSSLQVDISKSKSQLDWVPPISVEEGLRRALSPSVQLKG